jgi:hypothetical protein
MTVAASGLAISAKPQAATNARFDVTDPPMTESTARVTPFAALRRFAQPRPVGERCELCGANIAAQHPHLFAPEKRQLLCACDACSLLFSDTQNARFRRVPRRVQFLPDFRLADAEWDGLGIPINLAFFCFSSPASRVVALYPSPAGATEAQLPPEAWEELISTNPALRGLESDVEALLVNRVGQTREHYIVPIDACFKLVGLIRTHWRGLSGGTEVWDAVGRFFAELKERSSGGAHA